MDIWNTQVVQSIQWKGWRTVFKKIKDIKVVGRSTLKATFTDDVVKVYDVQKMVFSHPIFQTLSQDQGLFKKVRVDIGGYGVSWNDDIDLSAEEIFYEGH